MKIQNEIEGEPQFEQKDIINYGNSFHIFNFATNNNKTFHSATFLPFFGPLKCLLLSRAA